MCFSGLDRIHKCFRSRHTGDLSQAVQCRCPERPQEPSTALLWPKAGGSCIGLPASSTSKKREVPISPHALPSQGTLGKKLWRRCKNALFSRTLLFRSPRGHEPQADRGSATWAAKGAAHHRTSKSHS